MAGETKTSDKVQFVGNLNMIKGHSGAFEVIQRHWLCKKDSFNIIWGRLWGDLIKVRRGQLGPTLFIRTQIIDIFFIAECFSGTAKRQVETIMKKEVIVVIITIAMSIEANVFSSPLKVKWGQKSGQMG